MGTETTKDAGIKISLGSKVSGITAATLIIFAALTTWVTNHNVAVALTEQMYAQGEGLARGLASVLPDASSHDASHVKTLLGEFSKAPGVAYALISEPAGRVLQHSADGALPSQVTENLSAHALPAGNSALRADTYTTDSFGDVLDVSFPTAGAQRVHIGMRLALVAQQTDTATLMILVALLAFIVAGTPISYQLTRMLVRPLFAVAGVVGQVSTGNLSSQAAEDTNDEFLILGRSLNNMIASLRSIVSSVRLVTRDVDGAAEEIVSTCREQERGVTDQVAGFEEIAQTMTALADTARAIATNAGTLTQTAETMSSDVQRGQTTLMSSRESMAKIVEQNTIIADRINRLYEQSESIIAVIDIIDNISDRLDLLALNAALEGSRAGEVGKGFSLVAAEMRRLAENVSGSTKEIKGTIQDIHGLVRGALEASQQGSDTTRLGAQEMEITVEAMSQVFMLVERTTVSARQITVITQQQLSSSQAIAVAMRDVAAISMQGVQSARDVTHAAKELAVLSSSLQSKISVFTVEGATPESDVSRA